MRHFLILALVVIIAIGCTTTKHLLRSNEISTIDSSTVAYQSDSIAISKNEKTSEAHSNIDASEDLEFEIKIYDTDKPIDSTTGKPPLKQEINAKKKKQTNAQSNQSAKTIQSDSVAASKTETTKQKKDIQQKGTEDIEQKTKFIFPWLGIIGGGAIALLIISIIKLWKSKFLKRR